jgi:hypothetical protein
MMVFKVFTFDIRGQSNSLDVAIEEATKSWLEEKEGSGHQVQLQNASMTVSDDTVFLTIPWDDSSS